MKTILLVCNAGMSTSMLVKKMQDAAKTMGVEVEISAKSLTEAKKNLGTPDMINWFESQGQISDSSC